MIALLSAIGELGFAVTPQLTLNAIAGLGFTDDASVIATALITASTHITDEHRQQADDFNT